MVVAGIVLANIRMRTEVGRYTIRGTGLYDPHNRVVAVARGYSLYDGNNHRVATVRGNDLFDPDNRRMMSLRGSEIFDSGEVRIASIAEVKKSLDGALAAMLLVAFWFCFIR